MTLVPNSPDAFFLDYVPARLARMKPALGSVSSNFGVAFEVVGVGRYALKMVSGELLASVIPLSGAPASEEPLLTVAVAAHDFEAIFVASAERVSEELPEAQQLLAARVLLIDRESEAIVRSVRGSLGLALTDSDRVRRLLLAPSGVEVALEHPNCEIACNIEDFRAMQAGTANAFELLMEGKLTLSGDAQIAMALSRIFVS